MVQGKTLVALAALSLSSVNAIDLDINSSDSIKSAASEIAHGLVSFYNGNETGETVGTLDPPYYWWEAGMMWNTLIRYWSSTGDSQYNKILTDAIVAQGGNDGDFMPVNQTKTLGNDDQATWALTAMSAAELGLPEVPNGKWADMAAVAFDEQTQRWSKDTCNGGLRWQIFTFNQGYNYKNSISQGLFFELAARLARYTGNETYATWASTAFDWTKTIALITDDWKVYDGTLVDNNCTEINEPQFSLNAATFVAGAATMYNITKGDDQGKWKKSLDGLLNQTLSTFFKDGIAVEAACESKATCNIDQRVYKGVMAQKLFDTMHAAPYTSDVIRKFLISSAQAAAKSCGKDGCPFVWADTVNDGFNGVGEQINALSFVQALLAGKDVSRAANATSGGASSSASGTGTSTKPSATASGSGTPSTTPSAGSALRSENFLVGMMIAFGVSLVWML